MYQHIILRGYFQSMGGIFRTSVVVEVKTNLLQRALHAMLTDLDLFRLKNKMGGGLASLYFLMLPCQLIF